ncbi:TPA: AAA family ATPase, partial [Staphylococcus aureus]|nr:AAA family ATPase [Staphylococcus aureus]
MGEKDFVKDLNKKLMKSKNIILRGSPGTGKSYLSKAIASELIGTAIEELEDSDQFEFVQFHPSYDYTDFVEGIRPTVSQTGEMGFELRSGIFKEFCSKAARSLNNSENKKFVFVIDEINRGEISKIFGELFFSIDPSYRGKKGSVKTQYTNMEKSKDKFYIPDNVYIIGTMNDIDRSIDTFDFAMRRRFRFIKIEANENTQMLATLGDKKDEAIDRMIRLNEAISSVEELNSNYHIGAAYFLKLRAMTFEELWKDYLQPLLEDYIRGMFNEENIMNRFESAYYGNSSELGEDNEET